MYILNKTTGELVGPLKLEKDTVSTPSQLNLTTIWLFNGVVALWNTLTGALLAGPKKICDGVVTQTCLALFSSETDGKIQTRMAIGFQAGPLFVWDTVRKCRGPIKGHRHETRILA